MELITVRIRKPDDMNMILGQSHFIKTVEDIHEALVTAVPNIRFGLAFCESSGPCLIRASGTDPDLVDLAKQNAMALAAGHVFIILLKDIFPINVLSRVREVQEVCGIFCATANPVEVILAESDQGRGVLGVIDGFKSKGIESEKDISERRALLRKIGYKA